MLASTMFKRLLHSYTLAIGMYLQRGQEQLMHRTLVHIVETHGTFK